MESATNAALCRYCKAVIHGHMEFCNEDCRGKYLRSLPKEHKSGIEQEAENAANEHIKNVYGRGLEYISTASGDSNVENMREGVKAGFKLGALWQRININPNLETLKRVKFMFGLHSDASCRTNGYRSLCEMIEKAETQSLTSNGDGVEAIEFAEWLEDEFKRDLDSEIRGIKLYIPYESSRYYVQPIKMYTMGQLYELFKNK